MRSRNFYGWNFMAKSIIIRVLPLSSLAKMSCLAFSWLTVRRRWTFHKRIEFVACLWSYWAQTLWSSIKQSFLSAILMAIASHTQASLAHSRQERSCTWSHDSEYSVLLGSLRENIVHCSLYLHCWFGSCSLSLGISYQPLGPMWLHFPSWHRLHYLAGRLTL